MATDGIKIIDSDLAHDTYNMLMDYYDAGATLEQVDEKFPLTEDKAMILKLKYTHLSAVLRIGKSV